MAFSKTIILAVSATALLHSCRVNPRFSKLSSKEQTELTPAAMPSAGGTGLATLRAKQTGATTEAQVFKVDVAAIQQLVGEKDFTHVYVYASFCKPCVAEMPAIMQMHDARPEVGLVMVTPESWMELNRVKSFLAARQVGFPTYILDMDKYGDEHSGAKRYMKLLDELYPGYGGAKGFPTHLLLNREYKVLYATAGAGHFNAAVLDSVLRANR
jgi:thiol-disulfide isomerase/thioredoxin